MNQIVARWGEVGQKLDGNQQNLNQQLEVPWKGIIEITSVLLTDVAK